MRIELENRLVGLTLSINKVCRSLHSSYLAQQITTQIIRSSSSAALNYGETQAAESKKDFVHKISIVLKELRETKVSLKLLRNSVKEDMQKTFSQCQSERDQLIAIFHKTIVTAKAKLS